jgi:glycosyltransferase involved in cell wall biosynthesis
MNQERMERYVIISPCYNEEDVISIFLNELETIFQQTPYHYTVVIVDDYSTDGTMEKLKEFQFASEKYDLKPIRLKYNLGHQGAIHQGLKYASSIDANGYIVMDSDGEDDPQAILKLVKIKDFDIVFVSRGKRKESLFFKLGYYFYRLLFKIISGNKINFGNYSMISKSVVNCIHPQEFVHYSAFLSKQRFKKIFVKFDRRKRIDGKSKMNSNNLIMHGLKSMIEYSDELLFFFMRLLVLISIVMIGYIGYVLYTKFISQKAVSGWSSTITISLVNSMLIISAIIVLGLLIISRKDRGKSKEDLYKDL